MYLNHRQVYRFRMQIFSCGEPSVKLVVVVIVVVVVVVVVVLVVAVAGSVWFVGKGVPVASGGEEGVTVAADREEDVTVAARAREAKQKMKAKMV